MTVASASITLSDHIKSLSVTTHMSLMFDQHTRNICKTSYFHIQGFRQVRGVMDQSTINAVACAIISSRMDYCNAFLVNMSGSNLDKLQHVQNCLLQVVTGTRRRHHIRPVLKELHLLAIQARLSFEITTPVHKVRTSH